MEHSQGLPDTRLSRRSALKALGGSLLANAIRPASYAGSPELDSAGRRHGSSTLLFFDDEPLYSRSNLRRRLGHPERIGSYHEAAGNCTWGRPAVFRQEDEWRMVFQAGVGQPNRGGGTLLLARSPDGLDWEPFDTSGKIRIEGRRAPHQILPDGSGNFGSVIEDPRGSESQRYKLLTVEETVDTAVWASPNLLNWRRLEGRRWHPNPPDPPVFAYWNELKRRYILTTRPEWPDRRICMVETADWREFTAPLLALHADSEDRPLAQHYGLYVVPYDGYYVGFLWVYYAGDASSHLIPHRYRGGRVETYLAYSLNGIHWQRCMHMPFFRNGRSDEPDAGCLQVSNLVRMEDGGLRAYAACSRSAHGICPPNDGYINVYALRKDGFVCLEAGASTGQASTRTLFWRGGEATLNVNAASGHVRARIVTPEGDPIKGYDFEDSLPLASDNAEWIPQWRDGHCLAALGGRMIRLELEMTSAQWFSLRGNFIQCHLLGLRRWRETGEAPEPNVAI